MKQIDSKKVLYGAHIGEHGYELDALTDEIKRLCIARGMNFVTIRVPRVSEPIPEKYLIDWAKFCADNKIYFIYLYTLQHALHFKGTDRKSFLTRETVAEIKRVAGEYYMGDMLGELGSVWVGKLPGYYVEGHPPMLKQDAEDMETAKGYFKSAVQDYLKIERELGIDKVCVVESSMIVTYGLEAGIDFALAELMPRDPERMIGIFRGTMKSFDTGIWGAYFAHEWYAGRFHDDMIKRKRLELEYKMAYMNGAGVLCHESGDEIVNAYGRRYEYDSDVCRECRDFIRDFADYLNSDNRPTAQPITKFAFVQGNLDSQRGGGGGCFAWGQYDRKDWGYNEPEWSWRITDEVNRKAKWSDPYAYECYGENLTGQVPYGTYDIIPATADASAMSSYDTLVYTGWNTMTESQLSSLEKFVESGGTLLINAAHLNTETRRNGSFTPIESEISERLFGCKFTGNVLSYNYGVKFRNESYISGFKYPTSLSNAVDPNFSEGYIDYAEVQLTDAKLIASIEDSFRYVDKPGTPAIIENKYGKGQVILMLNACYPGRNSVYPLYSLIVRELMLSGVREANVRVVGPDTLRYSVFDDGSVYLLNTDYDTEYAVEVHSKDKKARVTLAPLELKHININQEIFL
ncbi:MAG: hypothetical protein J6Q68_03895 [Clostridia bacterium]|nr:hypothetical protein [Clostridia bacterium]